MILDKIVAHKRREVFENKNTVSLNSLQEACEHCPAGRPFADSLKKTDGVSLIAEIKKASPSKGLIRSDFNPVTITQTYTTAGAAAISVLTDREFFQGRPEYLQQARLVTDLPLLRKEFVIDAYQVFEAKTLGADAILLIMAILTDSEATEYIETARSLKMECLVEVHTAEELDRALSLGAKIIGINNRDLNSFKTDLNTTFRLKELIRDPAVTVVSESGINTKEDVKRLRDYRVDAMLVGEALMREENIAGKISELLSSGTNSSEGNNC